MITIIDYGVGNLGSIRNMLRRVDADVTVSSDAAEVRAADKLILPGIGSFDHAVRELRASGLVPLVERRVLEEKVPLLGICVGAQLLLARSDEGSEPGLGWIDGETVAFPSNAALKIPHMGWTDVVAHKPSALWRGLEDEARFYFVHSYRLSCTHPEDVLATAVYGDEFPAAIERGNLAGVQFHPEKSHRFGMTLLRNFADSFGASS